MMVGLFWVSLSILAYIYFFFPVLILMRGLFRNRPVKKDSGFTPHVSVVIAAFNEEQSIREKLENLLSLDYPVEKLELIIASDGSTDGTDKIIGEYQERGIRLLSLPRQGKAKTLNSAISSANGEILVFSDANSILREDALRQLVSSFSDQDVGGVAGNQIYLKKSNVGFSGQGEHSYWSFDRILKEMESRAGNTISATGAIYAIRRSLFVEIPDGVTDDFITSTRVILQGKRLVFARDAIAFEPVSSSTGIEFNRKVRIMTRGFNGLRMVSRLFNPIKFGFYSVQLISHKLLRRIAFIPLILLALSNAMIWEQHWFFSIVFWGQVLFYGLAIIVWAMEIKKINGNKLLSMPYFFCTVNLAAMVAFFNFVRGKQIALWTPQRINN